MKRWIARARPWLIAGAAVAVLIAAVLVALPLVVRDLAVGRLEELTGRRVTIDDVDLNLFTRRLVIKDARVLSPPDQPPLVAVRRVEARVHLLTLLRGRVELDRLALMDPVIRVERTEPGRLNADDVVERWLARPAGAPLAVRIERLEVHGGRLAFADHAVDPDCTWTLAELQLDARDIVTVADAGSGRAAASFILAGAPGRLELSDLRVRPLRGRAALTLTGLDVGQLAAYASDVALRPVAGTFSTELTAVYDARGFAEVSGKTTLRDLALARRGERDGFVTAPDIALSAERLSYVDGRVSSGRIEMNAGRLTVQDRAAAPRRIDVTNLHAVFEGRAVPAAGPGRFTLTAALPAGGQIAARGTGELLPSAADLTVEIAGVDAALVRPWLPPDAAVSPTTGTLAATLQVRYTADRRLALSGDASLAGLTLARSSGGDLLRDERVEVAVRDVIVTPDGAMLGSARLEASPTLVDAARDQRFTLPRVTLSASGGEYPADVPTRVTLAATGPHGGRIAADGTARITARAATLDVNVHGLDVALARPYLPPDTPITLDRGRLDARLTVTWDGALAVDGGFATRDLVLLRRGQAEPFVEHSELDGTIDGLLVRGGALSLRRFALRGTPTLVDATATPPQQFVMKDLALTVHEITWPSRRPARLEAHAQLADGSRATMSGTFSPDTLATNVQAQFADVALTRAQAYLPPGAAITIEAGQGEATVDLRHTRRDGVHIDVAGVLRGLAVGLPGARGTRVRDDRITIVARDITVAGGAISLTSAAVDGTPMLSRGDEAASAFRRLHAQVGRVVWPGGGAAPVSLVADLPDQGRLELSGTLAPGTWAVDATVRVRDGALAPFGLLLPIDAPLAGRLDLDLKASLDPGTPAGLVAEGAATVRELRVGPPDTAPLRADEVSVEQVRLHGRRLDVGRLALVRPSALVERTEEGAFPLRAMLTPGADTSPAAASPAESDGQPHADDEGATADGTSQRDASRALAFSVGEARIEEGTIRFIDRATKPFFSQEITRLALTLHGLSDVGDERAQLTLQAIVGTDAALHLHGEVAPFATPFFLDVRGDLNDFAVPSTNPYLARFLDWIAQRGRLRTKVHYRIVGRELTATNEVSIERLDVARVKGDDERAQRLVGLPLGLVVALLKNAHGDIHLTLPVEGDIASPGFSFGDAIRSAFKNVLTKLVTGPFRAIGSIFRSREGGEPERVAIDPVTFPPGSAALTPDAAQQLQRVADFLRAAPYINLALDTVVSERDLQALRAQAVTARIQDVQRQERLADFAQAARLVYRRARPQEPVPDDPQAIIDSLARDEPSPDDAARALADRRDSIARSQLVSAAGIQPERLLGDRNGPTIGAKGDGRVEFGLQPAS